MRNGYLTRAASLAELADRISVPSAPFLQTLTRYNETAAKGDDPDFGKGSSAYNRYLGDPANTPNACLRPIEKGPFYALEIHAGDIGTSIGIVTDEAARVLDGQGAPIANLYAAGNDANSIMAGSYPNLGITLGPALTFGFIAAGTLGSDSTSDP